MEITKKLKAIRKTIVIIVIITVSGLLFISQANPPDNSTKTYVINWKGLKKGYGTTAIHMNSFQGKNDVLHVAPGAGGYDWDLLTYDLNQWAGQTVSLGFSMQVYLPTVAKVALQVNQSPSFPVIGGDTERNLNANQWHTIQGSRSINVAPGNLLYLHSNLGINQIYITEFNLTVNGISVKPHPDVVLNPDLNLTPMKNKFSDYFFIGNVINPAYMNEPHFSLLKHHFNFVTPENNLQRSELAPVNEGGNYRWTVADNMVNTMIANGIKVHGHSLVWHEMTPSWMTTGNAKVKMETYITTVLNHYRNKITSWNVVNEAMDDWYIRPEHQKNVMTSTDWKTCIRTTFNNAPNPWYEALGADYIEIAFRKAREVDPNITLYYNEYHLNNRNKAQAVFNMVRDINAKYKAEGNTRNLIEGIGMQCHYDLSVNVRDVRWALQLFSSLGVEITISELDVKSNTDHIVGNFKDTVMSASTASAQARIYRDLFTLFVEYSSIIKSVSMWGMDDHYCWLSIGNPCLFNRNLNAKSALTSVLNLRL